MTTSKERGKPRGQVRTPERALPGAETPEWNARLSGLDHAQEAPLEKHTLTADCLITQQIHPGSREDDPGMDSHAGNRHDERRSPPNTVRENSGFSYTGTAFRATFFAALRIPCTIMAISLSVSLGCMGRLNSLL